MGRWQYDWEVMYYTSGQFLTRKIIRARNRAEALQKLRESGERVIEVYRCERIDKW